VTHILIRHATKRFHHRRRGEIQALDNLNLYIKSGETVSVIGPTGCGKSTLLRAIAGLEILDEGEISFDNEDMTGHSPRVRHVGFVFQSYALYPHMRSYENLAFFFRLRKWQDEDIDERVRYTSQVMGLGFEALLGRMPRTLSGGEKQRVALARCIIRNPRVFLLDEPMSNLDAKLRVSTRAEIKKLLNRFRITTVFVTHDQTEAIALGDRIAVMRAGAIEQVGTIRDIYRRPANTFVAGFIGSPPMNLVPGLTRPGENLVDFGPFRLPTDERLRALLARSERVVLGIRPEHIYLAAPDEEGIDCEVVQSELLLSDNAQMVYLRVGPHNLIGRLPMRRDYFPGAPLRIKMDGEQILYYDEASGELLN